MYIYITRINIFMSIIGYHKADKYIITIETDDYRPYLKEEEIKSFDHALYETKSFIVIDIEDLNGDHYDSILDFIIDEAHNYTKIILEFFKIKELAFYLDFIFKRQWECFLLGYTGHYKEYLNDGTKVLEYFHINGVKNGEYKYYWNNNQIHELYYYVNNVKNGEFMSFYMNNNIKAKGYFIDNHLRGEYFEYDYEGNVVIQEYK